MSDSLVVREATREDVADLLNLYRHLNPDDPPLDIGRGEDLFDRLVEQAFVLVGTIGAEMMTSCTLVIVPNLTRGGAPYALIENVVTDAAYRKRGFGTAILRAAQDVAWKQGCYKVMLLTGSKKPATLRFYAEAGFEQTKTGYQARRFRVPSD